MGHAFSPIHWIILLIDLAMFVIAIVAVARILRRLGYSAWWILLGFVPFGNVIGLWQLSKADWPALKTAVVD